jgi:hypothetical protein
MNERDIDTNAILEVGVGIKLLDYRLRLLEAHVPVV